MARDLAIYLAWCFVGITNVRLAIRSIRRGDDWTATANIIAAVFAAAVAFRSVP